MSEQGSLQRIPYTPHLDRVGRIFREVMGRKVGEDRHEDVASLESAAPCDQHRGNDRAYLDDPFPSASSLVKARVVGYSFGSVRFPPERQQDSPACTNR